jgi:hypothetical protein
MLERGSCASPTPHLSLVGFSSGGLLRATSGDLGLRLLGTRRRRRPRFGNYNIPQILDRQIR